MKKLSSKIITLLGLSLIAISLIAIAYPLYFNQHLSDAKAKLLKKHNSVSVITPPLINSTSYVPSPSVLTQLPAPTSLSCSSSSAQTPSIVIPSLSLVAPVEEGLSSSVLDVAVGHLTSSPWPLKGVGYSIFAAHDVSYFAHIDQLNVGDKILYTTNCTTVTYVVTKHFVSSPNSPIDVANGESGVVLDTCYPTNALWYTNQRYIVVAKYQGTSYDVNGKLVSYSSIPPMNLSVNIPTSIPVSSLSLANNSQEMGTLSFTGSPSLSYQESINPMEAEGVALENYFAILNILKENSPLTWSELTNLPYPSDLVSTPYSTSPLEVSEDVVGNDLKSVTLKTQIGTHRVSITQSVVANMLSISSIEVG